MNEIGKDAMLRIMQNLINERNDCLDKLDRLKGHNLDRITITSLSFFPPKVVIRNSNELKELIKKFYQEKIDELNKDIEYYIKELNKGVGNE